MIYSNDISLLYKGIKNEIADTKGWGGGGGGVRFLQRVAGIALRVKLSNSVI